ncbi:MAG: ABC transporter ATP-binding protein [Rhizobiaceae bacterium]|nr:ABC transporter ATP-binding protein [Rhizobiaceae bacterium]
MSTDALVLERVNAHYGDSHVLRDVTFSVRDGSLLALLGRNGAGKTTCLSTIIGFLSPSSGAILMHGVKISSRSPEAIARAGIGIVPQGRRIFRSLSVEENLLVSARGKQGGGEQGWVIEDIFRLFPRLQERRKQSGGALSGGEQQMLAIGRALMTNPKILLLDEPAEGLAPQIVQEVGRIIRNLKERGLTIVLVEQQVSFALAVADEALLLNTGRVVYQGIASELAGQKSLLMQHLAVH